MTCFGCQHRWPTVAGRNTLPFQQALANLAHYRCADAGVDYGVALDAHAPTRWVMAEITAPIHLQSDAAVALLGWAHFDALPWEVASEVVRHLDYLPVDFAEALMAHALLTVFDNEELLHFVKARVLGGVRAHAARERKP